MRNTRRSDVAPIQTPQRLNRLIDRSAEWPELSGTESKGSRGHLRSLRTFFTFFIFFRRTGSCAQPGYWDPSYRLRDAI